MNEQDPLSIFKDKKALLEGHFKLSSGLHSDKYIQCALVLKHPDIAEKFGKELAKRFKGASRIDTVLSPAIGGLIIGHEVARALQVPHIFTERKHTVMTLRRGFTIEEGEHVLIIEDVLTTGASAKELIGMVTDAGGIVVGVGALVQRGIQDIDFGVWKKILIQLNIETYNPEECPLCKEFKKIEKPGSRS